MSNSIPYLWQNNGQALTELLAKDFDSVQKVLHKHGAIMFRGFAVESEEKLKTIMSCFPGESIDYIDGNSPRTKLSSQVYTSTDYPKEVYISLHNELSYSSSWPSLLFFCCVTPATEGGATLVYDGREMLRALPEEIVNTFREKGICYIRNLHGGVGVGPSWQTTFETESQAEVEEHCKASDIEFAWQGDSLRLRQYRQATVIHPVTGEEVWFNQADQFHPSTNPKPVYEAMMEIYGHDLYSMPQYACFADGSEIPVSMLDQIREVSAVCFTDMPWEKGDVLIVDNVLAAHGRAPFEGERRVLVSMLK